jgi:hypothetical protein
MDSPTQTLTLYDQDFSLWVEAQVSALKTQRYDELDLPNLLEELESLTRRDRRSLKSHLRVLLMHLLKWQFQLQKRTVSWQVTIANARQNIADILEDSPSLRSYLTEVLADCYQAARKLAATETQLAIATFPETCPYSIEQILTDDHC